MMLLKVYQAYKAAKKNKVWLVLLRDYCHNDGATGLLFFQAWSRENFIHSRNMKTVLEVRRQLQGICERNQIHVTSSPKTSSQSIRMALLRGLFMNVAEAQDSCYRTVCADVGRGRRW